MSIKVGINGFGRIGRCVMRGIMQNKNLPLEVVAINGAGDTETYAHLLQYDSVHGTLEDEISFDDENLIVHGKKIKKLNDRDPANLGWGELGVDLVLDSTGKFNFREGAMKHIQAGAKKVILSAPAKDPDIMVVLGVNDHKYDKSKHHIISNASCTTNCLAPLAKVINDSFGIVQGLVTTVHAYTTDQNILDLRHKDIRRARAAGLSIIPTSTGAAKAVGIVLPELNGKLDGIALRVPTPNVSLVDLACTLEKDVTVEDVNNAIKKASLGSMKGIIQYCEKELVSIDFNGNPHSTIYDVKLTKVMNKNFLKVFAWYDNEWGYSMRTVELMAKAF